MVARVTVRVLTPYVNPAIWSILQSKRIGFLWRWISSAGKLSLSVSPLPATFWFFFHITPYLFIYSFFFYQLTGFPGLFFHSPFLLLPLSSVCVGVLIWPHQPDPL